MADAIDRLSSVDHRRFWRIGRGDRPRIGQAPGPVRARRAAEDKLRELVAEIKSGHIATPRSSRRTSPIAVRHAAVECAGSLWRADF